MSAEDADIVRRIRERCPDNRFDGGSDDKLIQLFKRNPQVLGPTDDDVIAAMVPHALTHEEPRTTGATDDRSARVLVCFLGTPPQELRIPSDPVRGRRPGAPPPVGGRAPTPWRGADTP
jgi:hypothetical protein